MIPAVKDAGRGRFAIYAAVEGAQLVSPGFNDIALYDRTVEAYQTAGLIP